MDKVKLLLYKIFLGIASSFSDKLGIVILWSTALTCLKIRQLVFIYNFFAFITKLTDIINALLYVLLFCDVLS